MTKSPIYQPVKTPEQIKGKQAVRQFMKAADPTWEWIRRKGTRSLRQLYSLLHELSITPEKVFALFLGETIEFPSEKDLNDAMFRETLCLKGKYGLTIADIAETFGIDPSRRYDVARLEDQWKATQARRHVVPRVAITEQERAVGDEILRHFRQGHWALRKRRLTEDLIKRLHRHF